MYLNLLVTMVVGGLWHGANLRFIIWGAIHGTALSVEKLFRQLVSFRKKRSLIVHFISVFFTFHLVSFAWIFFRLENNDKVKQFFYQLGNRFIPQNSLSDWAAYGSVLLIFGLGLLLIWTPFSIKEKIRGNFIDSPIIIQILWSVVILVLISLVSQSSMQPFIYFRF